MEGADGTKERQRGGVRKAFYFREKRHSSFSQANALIKRSDKFRCSTQRRCLRYRVFASFTPCLCGIFHLNYNVGYFI